jgi:hypothetical protein
MSPTFWVVRVVLMRISAPSYRYQTGAACGDPAGLAPCARAGQVFPTYRSGNVTRRRVGACDPPT